MARRCTSCGASVELPPDVMATTCRFCDASLVDDGEAMSPVDRVVPFVLDSKRAEAELMSHLSAQWLAPERVRHASQKESLRGVLVPFFAYQATTRSSWSGEIGIEWERTETYTTTDSNGDTVTETRTVTETEWFSESGTHADMYVNHLVSASRGIAEEESNELEPFDLGRSLPYAPQVVAGNVAEHPTVPRDEAASRAQEELTERALRRIKKFLPGQKSRRVTASTAVDIQDVSLVLLPVWIAVVREGDTVMRLLVNGQTGEVVGDVPTSHGKVAVIVLTILTMLGVVAYLVWVNV